jgi:stage II sporulation protein D
MLIATSEWAFSRRVLPAGIEAHGERSAAGRSRRPVRGSVGGDEVRAITVRRATVAAIAWALAAPAAAPADRWVIEGRGFGHGVGLSQYGAYGFAKHGKRYERILGHYFRGTEIERARERGVKVLLATQVGEIAFSGADRACGRKLRERKRYRFAAMGNRVALRSGSGARLADCGGKGSAGGDGAVVVGSEAAYRGRLVARNRSGSLDAINAVGIDAYVRGVVANEMPSSWPAEALRAQAVVARSYALASRVKGRGFDLYDDTRSQVYGGKTSETKATDRAVKATRREVVEHRGKVATTFYFSTSGGETENVEYGFPGARPSGYLKSVKDPYDDLSPYHRWHEKLSEAKLEEKLGGLVEGNLRAIEITKRGASPRIVKARVVGSRGSEKVTGPSLQYRLGLKSTWARFKQK